MLSASQRGWFLVIPESLDILRPAIREAAAVGMVVFALVALVAFGPDVADRLSSPVAEQAQREPAAVVRLADGERALAAWGQRGAARVRISAAHVRIGASEQRNIVRFLSQRYRVASDDVTQVVGHALRAGGEMGMDPLLLLAVMSIESSLDPDARSPAGAHGLMQVLTRVHEERFEPFGGPAAAFEPLPNIRVGAAILKEYLRREGSVEGALKSYVGAALRASDGGYGAKVLAERDRIVEAARGRAA